MKWFGYNDPKTGNMIIECDIIPEYPSSAIIYIFEKGDYRKRDQVFVNCFETAVKFYFKVFRSFNFILINFVIENTPVNRYLGVWRILEERLKINLPVGRRSESVRIEEENLRHVCQIELSGENIHGVLELLSELRNSLLIFGNCSEDFCDQVIDIANTYPNPGPNSRDSLIDYLAEKGLIGMRLFGGFDDIENGVIIYEPLTFFQKQGDWKLRLDACKGRRLLSD